MIPARPLIAVGLIACLGGCTSARLRDRTVGQGGTLPDLQYRQVLDNLALFSANPAALPWHINLREGTSQVTDSGSAGALIDTTSGTTQPQAFGSRTVVAQWGMSPVIDPTELRLLRFAYRRAHGSREMPPAEFLDELAHELKGQVPNNADLQQETGLFFSYQARDDKNPRDFDARAITTNDLEFLGDREPPLRVRSPLAKDVGRQVDAIRRQLAAIQPGWFHVGRRRDVPKGACYVGRSGDCYVWVGPEGREALTEFTLTVLKFSSLIKETQTLISPGSVKFSPGDRGG